jgi:argininosuccinate lyase
MKQATEAGYLLATDLADYLVKKGETFRSAHNAIGKLVRYASRKGKSLAELKLAEYKKFSPLFAKDVYSITIESSLAARNIVGGTAPEQVEKEIAAAKKMAWSYRGRKQSKS